MVAQTDDNQGNVLEEALTRFMRVCSAGEQPDIDEFIGQYPRCKAQLKRRIQELQEIDSLFDSLVQADEIEFAATATGYDLSGRKIGCFEIVEMIGRGGMGVVYLARDTKLKRSVAIKSMPVELQANATARTRFRREAELLASLNHPNIATIYDIIEQDNGAGYLILEYVPGETLAERIALDPLKLDEALSIGQQVAEAVSAAHDRGVIHRDLKPGNIKITPEGKVKVLDFGLAKASPPKGQSVETAVTQPGRIMGTPAYMSPEQACGKDTDYRTDIWSFGCVMYEMLTGNVPFDGETATDTVAMILERQPDWQALPQETPTNIRTLLRRCLEKDPNRRLRDIGDAAIEIKETHTMPVNAKEAGPGRINSLAVLPLQNLTRDPEQEYFADGLTDSLIAELGQIGALDVRSRTSIMQYKSINKSLPEIARELNVNALVEGSVLRLGNRVRITVQLIHALTDTHLWAATYERDMHNILTLLGEVTRTIASQIKITLTPDEKVLLEARRPISPEAYNLYLKGMFHLHKETPEGTKTGIDYLHQAIAQDPGHPLAYGALAFGYVVSAHGPGAPTDAFKHAKEAADKAIDIDYNVAEAHAALALTKIYREWDWEGASEEFHTALDLNPNLNMARAHYSWYLLLFNRLDDALAEMRKIEETDPLMPLWPAYLAWQYWSAERYDEAIKEADKALELAPNFHVALYVLGCAYAQKGMYEQAIELHEKAGQLSPEWKCGLGHTYAVAGRLDEARQALAELEADHTLWDNWFIAIIFAALGDKDQAFKWLEIAYGPPNHPYLPWIKWVPDFKPLRDDPRFTDLLRRMNLLQ